MDTNKEKDQSTMDEKSAGNTTAEQADGPSGKNHMYGDVSSDHANGPSGEDYPSDDVASHHGVASLSEDSQGTSGATERGIVLSNDTSGLTVKLFERDKPITISVFRDIAARAATSGLSLEDGATTKVPEHEA